MINKVSIQELEEILKKYNPEYTGSKAVQIGEKILELYKVVLIKKIVEKHGGD